MAELSIDAIVRARGRACSPHLDVLFGKQRRARL